jgi:PGAP1-like protein
MQARLRRCVPILLFLSLFACIAESPDELSATGENQQPDVTPASAALMLAALDLPPAVTVLSSSLGSPHADAAVARTSFGALAPSKGSSFVLLSTGKSNDASLTAEPGFDFPPVGPSGDVVTLRFEILVPHYLNQMSFDYIFLSSESPEFVGPLCDIFSVKVTDWLGDREVASASANSELMQPATSDKVGVSPFLLYVDNPSGVDSVFNTGANPDAGVTGIRRVVVPIRSGAMTVEISIRDLGDGILDSAALVDNFSFSAVETIDPQLGLVTARGAVSRDLQLLATGGQPVRAVAADGATQLLLRSKAPGPGLVTFSVRDGSPLQGSVALNDGRLQWGPSATVATTFLNGGYYAFVLYRSPEDFNRGGDELARERPAGLAWSFASDSGTGDYSHDLDLTITRPPLLVIPELWTNCPSWAGIPEAAAFEAHCADYLATSSRGMWHNAPLVESKIDEVLASRRSAGQAVTRVDVVGYGLGGLLARQALERTGYARAQNFFIGDISRLITSGTPHLGSRMAAEIVRHRDFSKRMGDWESLRTTLHSAGVFIDASLGDVAIDEMVPGSEAIATLGWNAIDHDVAYHAVIATRAKSVPRIQAMSFLGPKRILYMQMENLHPWSRNLSPILRQRLIFGTSSTIFCSSLDLEDDHDLFATAWEQQGGLAPEHTSLSLVSSSRSLSHHFGMHEDPLQVGRILQLLNAPRSGGLFAAWMPPPSTVPEINHCPIVLPP